MMVSGSGGFKRLDGLFHGHRAAGFVKVKQFGHLAIDLEHALAGIFGIGKRLDNCLRLLNLVRARGEDSIGRLQLRRMDQRLPVKTERTALFALINQAMVILDVIVHARRRAQPPC